MNELVLYFDGNKDPRSATASYRIEKDGKLIKEETVSFPMVVETENGVPINRPTVPELEYFALIEGLTASAKQVQPQDVSIHIYGDSQLIIQQMQGLWETKKGRLRELRSKARTAAATFKEVIYQWVPRKLNRVG